MFDTTVRATDRGSAVSAAVTALIAASRRDWDVDDLASDGTCRTVEVSRGWDDPGWVADRELHGPQDHARTRRDDTRPDETGVVASPRARQWGRMPVGALLVHALEEALGDDLDRLEGRAPVELSSADSIEALVALERLRSWVEGTATAVRYSLVEQRRRRPAGGAGGRDLPRVVAEVAAEVALAEGVSPSTAAHRVEASGALVTTPSVHREVLAGRLQVETARDLVAEVEVVEGDAADRDAAAAAVLAEAVRTAGDDGGVSVGTHPLWDLSRGRRRTLARRVVHGLDPGAAARRADAARADRAVRVRTFPDSMASLSAWLPAQDALVCAARLDDDARAARERPDEQRSLDQLRADHLVWRLSGGVAGTPPPSATGRPGADASGGAVRAVTVLHLTIDAATALGLADEPAELTSDLAGPRLTPPSTVDSATAREVLTAAMRRALDDPAAVQLHRVLTDPTSGVALDVSRRYRPSRRLARFLVARDRGSRFPTSDAPPREHDHVVPFDHTDPARGGPTSATNLEATGQRDHHVRHAPGWSLSGDASDRSCWVTPSGRRYTSTPPPIGRTWPGEGPAPLPRAEPPPF